MTVDDLDSDAVERYLAYRAERSRNRKRLGEATELLPALKAVVNAVVHRDYSRRGETVRVFVFPTESRCGAPAGSRPS